MMDYILHDTAAEAVEAAVNAVGDIAAPGTLERLA